MYSEDVATRMLEKSHHRGWNLYRKIGLPIDTGRTIREGFVERLEVDSSYVLLPVASDPRNPDDVMNALERLALKLNRKTPTIEICGIREPITGLTLFPSKIKLHTPEGTYISYEEFLSAIDTYVSALPE